MNHEFTNNDIIILGVRIDDVDRQTAFTHLQESFELAHSVCLVFTPNPEICLRASKDESYRKLLNEADLNVPDGVGLRLGAEILGQKLHYRVTGADLLKECLRYLNTKQGRTVYVIAKEHGLSSIEDIKKTCATQYPNINIQGDYYRRNNLSTIVDQVEKLKPALICTTLGAPDQEQVLVDLLHKNIYAPVLMAIGGAFDFITGKQKRAPQWWQDYGIEWFYRLLRQPQRVGRISDALLKFPMACRQWKKRMETMYRPNVLAVIKRDGLYYVQKNRRFADNHWQFPQGGIEAGETNADAAIREASEELGAQKELFRVIRQIPAHHTYEWPPWAKRLYGFKGQTQDTYLLEFLGTDADLHIETSEEVEAFQWVTKDQLVEIIHPVRHEALEKVLPYLQ